MRLRVQIGRCCLALVTDAFGGVGGIAQYNRDLLTGLVRSNVVPLIDVLPRYGLRGSVTPNGIRQVEPYTSRIGYVIAAISLLTIRPPLIFCGHLHLAPLAALTAKMTGAKLIVQMHGIEAWQEPNKFRKKSVEAADLVLCVSRYTRRAVLRWATIAPEKVVVIPNTVGDCFTPGDGEDLREELKICGKKVLLTVGRMDSGERYKGHDRIIAVIPRLIAEGYDIVYVIVGEGDDRPRLEELAAKAGVSERIKFLGLLESGRLVDAYRMADLFVMPSTGEGFGIAFLEAMACGTPALGLDVAGATDALGDGKLGTLTSEPNLPTAIVHALARAKPDRYALAAAVRLRFGREVFEANLRDAILPLFQQAA